VQLRAHGDEHPASVEVGESEVRVELAEPVYGIAPGQACVIYDGTRVVGSATIARTDRPAG
jgi:tRNA-specific 2-thiouridylase